jgi:RND family efflux transporter MFP subunit
MAEPDLSKLRIDKPKGGPLGRRGRKRIYGLIVLALLLTGAYVLYLKGFLTPAPEVTTVTVAETYPSQSLTLLNASGYVVPQRKAAVSSKVTGRLIFLGVEEGNRVRAGQIIARLESDDVAAARSQAASNLAVAHSSLEQAQAELKDALLSYERQKQLLIRGVVAKASYDAAEARYSRAEAGVAGAEASIQASQAALKAADVALDYTIIRAPFDAIVLTKNADIGDIVTPIGASFNSKASVVTIADFDSLQVEADVPESNLGQIKVGQPCEIQLDALPGARLAGAIHMIVPTADRSKATVMVKVRFITKDSRILPEMNAKVAFLSRPVNTTEQKPRVTVNPAAVVARSGRSVVFRVKENLVDEVAVKTGEKIGDQIEVLEGVRPGDRVVVKPPEKLKSGSRVKIAEK